MSEIWQKISDFSCLIWNDALISYFEKKRVVGNMDTKSLNEEISLNFELIQVSISKKIYDEIAEEVLRNDSYMDISDFVERSCILNLPLNQKHIESLFFEKIKEFTFKSSRVDINIYKPKEDLE